MRNHPLLGEEFFEGLHHMEPVRPIIRAHHERYDGSMTGDYPGYPNGLCGERIPLGARILKLAEAIDCMLHERPYRKALKIGKVRKILETEAGKSFDPRLTRTLLDIGDWHRALENYSFVDELIHSIAPASYETGNETVSTAVCDVG
jgi:response regulator RpfG family c-di-GMP phosphodiesterase